jgi:lipoprotein NlpI
MISYVFDLDDKEYGQVNQLEYLEGLIVLWKLPIALKVHFFEKQFFVIKLSQIYQKSKKKKSKKINWQCIKNHVYAGVQT